MWGGSGDDEQLKREEYAAAMAELVAHIAHEVNQPLAAMAANANACTRWLQAQPPNIEEAHAASARIVRDARRASEVIGEMRVFLSRTAPARETVALQEVVDEAIAQAAPAARLAHVDVRHERGNSGLRLLGRRNALRQAVRHLVDNAVEACAAMPEGYSSFPPNPPPVSVWITRTDDTASPSTVESARWA